MSKKFDGKQLAAQKKIELRLASGVWVQSSNGNDGKLHHVQVNDEVEGRREGAAKDG
jgi:hypothetical protein